MTAIETVQDILSQATSAPVDTSTLGQMQNALVGWNLHTPAKRFLFGAALGTILVWGMQPSTAFTEGSPRPFVLTANGSEKGQPTRFPWWMLPIGSGFVLSTFI